ncbi:hypothetical protein GCM10023194_07220 [Planotetraspora phitsanulokensis]|uniref:Uncharacterized protein n=1 Tax=Planotetraspora phitsanulokensis TaxID=575192 RepID=A0A8J3U5Z8_9ACTN|nr:hypothetical protein [Planotetraspora phitsanulokensis]GII39218.1 hypothetical protein Pph01_42210 [Planotetraspora phitsanulokensis]
MTDHHTYGTSAHTASELVRLVSDRLGLVFTERESDYRGVYLRAESYDGKIEIQPNPIPGDDEEDDLYAPEPDDRGAPAHHQPSPRPGPAGPPELHRRAHSPEPRVMVNSY